MVGAVVLEPLWTDVWFYDDKYQSKHIYKTDTLHMTIIPRIGETFIFPGIGTKYKVVEVEHNYYNPKKQAVCIMVEKMEE